MVIVVFMFGHAFYLLLADVQVEFHDVDEDPPFKTIPATLSSLYKMILGDFNTDAYPDNLSWLLFCLFMFVVVIVMLNVLIAIVSDSYDSALVASSELFWKARVDLISELSTTFERFITWYKRRYGDKKDGKIVLEIKKDSEGDEEWAGRVLDIVKRVNERTSSEVVTLKEQNKALKEQNDGIKAQNDDIKAQNDDIKAQLELVLKKLEK